MTRWQPQRPGKNALPPVPPRTLLLQGVIAHASKSALHVGQSLHASQADGLDLKNSDGVCREAKRGEWRAKQQVAQREEVHHKVAAAQAAEDAKMAAFRALAAKGPISIAKRT